MTDERARDACTGSPMEPALLERFLELTRSTASTRALDVATGNGAIALLVAPTVLHVTGIDVTEAGIARARDLAHEVGVGNVEFRVADVHDLPFPNASFDLVTTRRGPHHFADIERALGEIRRVLAPGGRFVADELSVPEDDFVDRTMHELDRLQSPSHVRQFSPRAWRRLLRGAGLDVDVIEPYERERSVDEFLSRAPEANRAKIREIFDSLDVTERVALGYAPGGDGLAHFMHWYVLIAARAPLEVGSR